MTFLVLTATLLLTACSPTSTASNSPQTANGAIPPSAAGSAATTSAGISISGQTPLIKVSNQPVVNGAVKIDEAVSHGPGWVVIYTMQNGQPGVPIGHAHLKDGLNQNVMVPIDAGRATENLYALLLSDRGSIGKFESPGPDGPQIAGISLVDATINTNQSQANSSNSNNSSMPGVNMDSTPGVVTATMAPDMNMGSTPAGGMNMGSTPAGGMNMTPAAGTLTPNIIVANQPIRDGHLAIPEVTSPSDGWVVIHIAYSDGTSGPMVGWARVHSGQNNAVIVQLNSPNPGTTHLSAMLHQDVSKASSPQFPGVDQPIMVNGMMVNPPFHITDSDHTDLVITLGNTPETENYLVDSDGRSLYVSLQDPPGQSTCDAVCLKSWQPLLSNATGKVVVGTGVQALKVGVIKRADGTLQATYNNAPLYRYIQDQKAGDVNGQGLNGNWYLVSP
ncbi:MAG: hypothetical protein P4L50_19525 [Anaerolineaceae bacterium]|nr:hypothetical protein [Anaerolineaceae bacterium]